MERISEVKTEKRNVFLERRNFEQSTLNADQAAEVRTWDWRTSLDKSRLYNAKYTHFVEDFDPNPYPPSPASDPNLDFSRLEADYMNEHYISAAGPFSYSRFYRK